MPGKSLLKVGDKVIVNAIDIGDKDTITHIGNLQLPIEGRISKAIGVSLNMVIPVIFKDERSPIKMTYHKQYEVVIKQEVTRYNVTTLCDRFYIVRFEDIKEETWKERVEEAIDKEQILNTEPIMIDEKKKFHKVHEADIRTPLDYRTNIKPEVFNPMEEEGILE